MLFRRPRKPADDTGAAIAEASKQTQQVLILFLIGERPTSGIHNAALGFVLNVIDLYANGAARDAKRPPETPIVFRIVGPYFSGSERSLSLVIDRWTKDRLKDRPSDPARQGPLYRFVIRSGSSNRINRKKFLTDCTAGGTRSPVEVDFKATVHHFDHVIRTLFTFLKEQNGGRDLGKVALLTESDTEFGRAIPEHSDLKRQWGVSSVTRMNFPFHISQVAAAYDATRPVDDKSAPILPRSSSKLRIPFDEIGAPNDVVPSLAPRMTAASEEFNLAKILETISMEDYRYVGIVASDTRDVIFLGGLIREYCPDVQLFTTSADPAAWPPSFSSQLPRHGRGVAGANILDEPTVATRPHAGDVRRHLFMHQGGQGSADATVSLVPRQSDALSTSSSGPASR